MSLILVLSVMSVGAGIYFALAPQQDLLGPKAPPRVHEEWPVLGALRFFTARWDFYQHARSQAKSGNFSFFLGKHPVVGLTGDRGRKLFFESKGLGFAEG